MSDIETHFGKLRKIDLQGVSIEDWCKDKCKEAGIEEMRSWSNSWKDEFLMHEQNVDNYYFINDEVWETFDHTELGDGDPINVMIPNPDETVTFVMQFYNGGTCLCEVLENGLNKLQKNNG